MNHVRRGPALATVALTALALGAAPAASHAATPSAVVADDSTGTYYQVAPTRLLDTRTGNGAPRARVAAGGTVDLAVTGRAAIPTSGVAAVVLNLTGIRPTRVTYLTASPAAATRPTASSINIGPGQIRANLVTVPVGSGGRVSIYNNRGDIDIAADVLGYYSKDDSLQATKGMGAQFQLAEPGRLFDSRLSPEGPLRAGEEVAMGPDFGADVNASVRALAVNVTAVNAQNAGYLQLYAENASAPTTSALNFVSGQTVPNMAIVPTNYNAEARVPAIVVKNQSGGEVDVIVDVVGYYDTDAAVGLRFKAISPTRIVDTRNGTGGRSAPLGQRGTQAFNAPSSVADSGTFALVTNTTAVDVSASTFVTVWDGTDPMPTVSNLNASAGDIVANAALAPLDDAGVFSVYNNQGTTDAVMDVSGQFQYHEAPSVTAAAPKAAVSSSGADRLTASSQPQDTTRGHAFRAVTLR